jgi:hypothetical protein
MDERVTLVDYLQSGDRGQVRRATADEDSGAIHMLTGSAEYQLV